MNGLLMVVGELGVWNTFLPVFKVLLYQHPEECSKASIDDLGLSIGLRMRGGREEELDADLGHENLPEVAHEFDVVVGDDCSWYTVQPNYFPKKQIGYCEAS